ncbi:MAG: ABC-F type ribosomal protection protein [Firmicutes bacterium]|nr:ABC-F type ribosomal protection protein [Bacillota bacterium]
MSQISISHLTFAYEGSYDNIFTDVSFQIDTNWKLGFCGRNGRGKTTFLQLLMGRYEYCGNITAVVDFEYFPYYVADPATTTQVALTVVAPDAPLWMMQRELSLLCLDENILYRPFSTLSSGEQTKVLLAGLFLRENAFLLIDEPTNHLDIKARQTVAKYLNTKTGFILVSHDRTFLDECIDHVLSINKANIEIQNGNFSSWFYNKNLQDEYELAENERLKKDIKRLEIAARQSAQWADKVESTKMGKGAVAIRKKGHDNIDTMAYNAEKSRRMQQRRKNLQHRQQAAIENKSKLLHNIETAAPLKLRTLTYHKNQLLSVNDLSVAYNDRQIFSGLTFTLEQGDRLALIGGNGCGKSSLLKLLCGENIPHNGTVIVGSRLVISYVPQDTAFLAGSLDEYIAISGIESSLFKMMLHKLDFSRIQFEKNMQDYSAGQKKKVLIAQSLCKQAHIYIWDEPLNYIDVLSRMQIEELILDYKPTLLFVEHDQAFCNNIAQKILDFGRL